MHVNVDEEWFMTDGAPINAVLKAKPEDFQVIEVPINHSLYSPHLLALSEDCLISEQELCCVRCPPVTSAPICVTNTPAQPTPAVEKYVVPPEFAPILEKMNSSLTCEGHEQVVLPGWLSKAERRDLHEHIQETYPFLRAVEISRQAVEADPSTSVPPDVLSKPDYLVSFSVRVDPSFLPLLHCGLTVADTEAVARFVHRGSCHPSAGAGVCVGSELDKEQRSAAYAALRCCCASLDSKTITTRSGEKKMLVHWKPKALRSAGGMKGSGRGGARGRDRQDNPESERKKGNPCQVIIGFDLLKKDYEQLEAFQRLSVLLHCSPSDLATAGVKDKKAVTVQTCCVTLRSSCTVCNQANTEGESEGDCEGDCEGDTSGVMRKRSKREEGARVGSGEPVCGRVTLVRNAIYALETIAASTNSAYRQWLVEQQQQSHESSRVSRPFIAVGNIRLRDDVIRLGELSGNHFKIVLRQVRSDSTCGRDAMSEISRRVEAVGRFGCPNLFGSQRMGTSAWRWRAKQEREAVSMPTGPSIGKMLLSGDLEGAAIAIVRDCIEAEEGSDDMLYAAEQFNSLFSGTFTDPKDIKTILQQVLNAIPAAAVRARMAVKAMIRLGYRPSSRTSASGSDKDSNQSELCSQILQQVPYSARSLWISAFQSWLWNRVVSYRLILSPHSLLPGDLVLADRWTAILSSSVAAPSSSISSDGVEQGACIEGRIGSAGGISDGDGGAEHCPEDGVDSRVHVVSEDDWKGLTIAQREAIMSAVVMPMFGSRVALPANDSGRFYEELLAEAGVVINESAHPTSQLHKLPRGAYRLILQRPVNISLSYEEDREEVSVSFSLTSGSYATSLLRELLHNNDVV